MVNTPSELQIPKSFGGTTFTLVLATITIVVSVLAAMNFLARDAMVASSLWFLFLAYSAWGECKSARGVRKLLRNMLGVIAGRHFVDCVNSPAGQPEVRFGYCLCGHIEFYLQLPVSRVETVEWSLGQASGMTGRDMNDWHVVLWYDPEDPSKRRGWGRKPDQDLYIVGPSRRRGKTQALGLALVEFLNLAGAQLMPGEGDHQFVRQAAPDPRSAAVAE